MDTAQFRESELALRIGDDMWGHQTSVGNQSWRGRDRARAGLRFSRRRLLRHGR